MISPADISRSFRYARLLMLFFSVLTLSGCGGGDSETPYTSSPEMDRAVANLKTNLENALGRTVPSLSVLIETPQAAFFATSSTPDERRVTPRTYFRFASNTKNFTATAILKMHQDGWLNYTDRIVGIIPGGDIPYVPDTAAWDLPYKDRISIRQLLQHNAGVYDVDNSPVPGCGEMGYVDCVTAREPDHHFTSSELVGQAAAHNLSYFPPGTANHHYSNTGYTILGEVIARVYSNRSNAAKTYADYLRDHIHGPGAPVTLRLGFPFLPGDRELPAPYVCGIIINRDGQMEEYCAENMSGHVAEGNGYGTMSDLNTHIRTLFKGQSVLGAQSIDLMINDVSPGTTGYKYSLGTLHAPNLGYGHTGAIKGTMSFMAYDPQTDVSVIVLLPMWDESRGMDSFYQIYNTLFCAGWDARAALGYPGRPDFAVCPGDGS